MERTSNLDWANLFHQVCTDKSGLLAWSLPEPWVQAELFYLLRQQQHDTDWHPIEHEVPYVTYFPVKRPEKRNLLTDGAVKWVDMALFSNSRREWCWLELKVRRAGDGARSEKSGKAALTAIKQDVAALVGMNIAKTTEAWVRPDGYTASYWFEEVLRPVAGTLGAYSHNYVMAYLHLFGAVDEERFSKDEILRQIESWVIRKNRDSEQSIQLPELSIDIEQCKVDGKHSLILVRWDKGCG